MLPAVAVPVLPKVPKPLLPVVPPIPVYKFALPDVKGELAKAFVGLGIAQAATSSTPTTPASALTPTLCMLLLTPAWTHLHAYMHMCAVPTWQPACWTHPDFLAIHVAVPCQAINGKV